MKLCFRKVTERVLSREDFLKSPVFPTSLAVWMGVWYLSWSQLSMSTFTFRVNTAMRSILWSSVITTYCLHMWMHVSLEVRMILMYFACRAFSSSSRIMRWMATFSVTMVTLCLDFWWPLFWLPVGHRDITTLFTEKQDARLSAVWEFWSQDFGASIKNVSATCLIDKPTPFNWTESASRPIRVLFYLTIFYCTRGSAPPHQC